MATDSSRAPTSPDQPQEGRTRTAALTPAESGRLVFVGGLHRSGTTPTAKLLASHPEVSGFENTGAIEDEGQHLQRVYPPALHYGGAGRFAHNPGAHLTEVSELATRANAQRLLDAWAPHWDLNRTLLIEKSPPNMIMTRFLTALFPGSKFVIVVRHPVTVALATLKWMGADGSVEPLLRHWVKAHQLLLRDLASVDNVHVIKYEHLTTDPLRTLSGLQSFLGLTDPLDGAVLDRSRGVAYQEQWNGLRARRAPWARWEMRGWRKAHGRDIAAFGYELEDLAVVRPFPSPAVR